MKTYGQDKLTIDQMYSDRQLAKDAKHKYYFSGKACIHGHITPRRVDNNCCIECARAFYKKRYAKVRKPRNKQTKEEKADREKVYYQANQEKILQRQKAYNLKNKEKIKVRQQRYYQENKERYAQNHKEWCQANKEKEHERGRLRYQLNPDRFIARSKAYYEENKDVINAKRREKRRKK